MEGMRAAAFDRDTGQDLKAGGPGGSHTVRLQFQNFVFSSAGSSLESEERPAPAEVGTQLGSPSVLCPLLLLTCCVVLISYRWLLALQIGLVQQLWATIK